MSRKTREETLATRRRNKRTRLGERTHGRPERMSPIGAGGGGLLDEGGRTAGFVATPELYWDGVWSPLARRQRRRRWNAVKAGFFLPPSVRRPDCHPPMARWSRSRNHSIM